jgi:arylsulfatase A-like enzyme
MTRNEWKGKCGTDETKERNNKSFVRSAVFAYFVFSLALAAVSLGYHRILAAGAQSNQAKKQPNIIWLVLDDASPTLGCYGDPQAITPNMDRLAREGARFTRAFTHAPVCAPSRSGLVTGMYPTTIGSHHMRSKLINPPETFMSLLRKAGYYLAWPGKTDFNFDPADPKAATSATDPPAGSIDSRANWLETPPPRQPFFAYLNLGVTHESQVRADAAQHAKNTARLKPGEFHNPAKMKVPAYYPDAPEIRKDLAQYYDLITAADYQVGDILAWIDKHGIADETVVILFSDHGRGMPRAKRWLYDSGIHVPLIVRAPGRIKPGATRNDLVSFIDFAPTMLALAGAEIPERLQGQVFLGDKRPKPRGYVYAAADRMDNAVDRIRAVRDERYKYIRNFHPELPYAQRIPYNEENPTMRVWRKMSEEGRLSGPTALFFSPTKPKEELYDTEADPDEVRNLATDPKFRRTLERMRKAMDAWIRTTKDMGEIPEEELIKRGVVRDVLKEYANRK